MYAGTTLRDSSGNLLGGHQKIDRLARHMVRTMAPHADFPLIGSILQFEGKNGPDGIKRKSPGFDEPWHFFEPHAPEKGELLTHITDHHANLVAALKKQDVIRASFEAAWLAHVIVDGLTPAHHYPLHDKIEELWGKPHTERISVIDKNFIRGKTRRDTVKKNWEYWGSKGVFATHASYELGVATAIAPIRRLKELPDPEDRDFIKMHGLIEYFKMIAVKVDEYHFYERYHKQGWTRENAREIKTILLPMLVNTVALAWLDALEKTSR